MTRFLPTAPDKWTTYVGIDPAATTGLVCVRMPPRTFRLVDARLVGFAVIDNTGTAAHLGHARSRARLMHRVRDQLTAWRAEVIVIEEPWDALPGWGTRQGGKNVKGGASRGTTFKVGVSFGLVLAAAADLPWDTSIASYPVTSAREKRKPTKKPGLFRTVPERLGWMQRRLSQPPAHERVAAEQALTLAQLKTRPTSGVLPTRAELQREEDDNVYMALGVLAFHLDRERGIL